MRSTAAGLYRALLPPQQLEVTDMLFSTPMTMVELLTSMTSSRGIDHKREASVHDKRTLRVARPASPPFAPRLPSGLASMLASPLLRRPCAHTR